MFTGIIQWWSAVAEQFAANQEVEFTPEEEECVTVRLEAVNSEHYCTAVHTLIVTADEDALYTLPQIDGGFWYVDSIIPENSVNVRIMGSTVNISPV